GTVRAAAGHGFSHFPAGVAMAGVGGCAISARLVIAGFDCWPEAVQNGGKLDFSVSSIGKGEVHSDPCFPLFPQ
ncbi:MAG: hypothetical protein J7507_06175, partial [Pseudoxanthomonas sp.]|nr:hypothetical protein [Pseudoxanthomonas sp.]